MNYHDHLVKLKKDVNYTSLRNQTEKGSELSMAIIELVYDLACARATIDMQNELIKKGSFKCQS